MKIGIAAPIAAAVTLALTIAVGEVRGDVNSVVHRVTPTLAIPLAQTPQGQKIAAETARRLALADVQFTFLNKEYENDVWAKDPLGNRYRLSCVRLKATSGFAFRVDQPTVQLNQDGLTIQQNIAKVKANGINVKFQFGPCMWSSAGLGIEVDNVSFTYKFKPMVMVSQGLCHVSFDQFPDHLQISIGDMHITGVNDQITKLAKDAIREGVNSTLEGGYLRLVTSELAKVSADFCGN